MLTLIATIILNLPIDNQIFKECPIFYHNFKKTEISISSAVKQGSSLRQFLHLSLTTASQKSATQNVKYFKYPRGCSTNHTPLFDGICTNNSCMVFSGDKEQATFCARASFPPFPNSPKDQGYKNS